MKKNLLKKIAAVVSAISIMFAMGATAFAGETTDTAPSNDKSAIWSILTEDQKETLTANFTEQLAQELADGKITQDRYDEMLTAIESGEIPMMGQGGHGDKQLNSEKSEGSDAMQEKWDALTDEQKSELYDLTDQQASIESQIIDKYLEFGLIDSDTATEMKERIETQKSEMRTDNRMPMMKDGGSRGAHTAPAGETDSAAE